MEDIAYFGSGLCMLLSCRVFPRSECATPVSCPLSPPFSRCTALHHGVAHLHPLFSMLRPDTLVRLFAPQKTLDNKPTNYGLC